MFILIDGSGTRSPPLLQQQAHHRLRHRCRYVRLCHCRRPRCSPLPSPPPSSPPLRLGDGACERAHNLIRIGQGGGSILSGDGKKVKNHGIVRCVTHNFYVKINPRQKSGNAVACASVPPWTASPDSPQKNKYKLNHCTAEEEWGGEVILHY